MLAQTNGHGNGVPIRDWQQRCVSVEGVPRRTFFDAKAALLKAGRVHELDGARFLPGGAIASARPVQGVQA